MRERERRMKISKRRRSMISEERREIYGIIKKKFKKEVTSFAR